MEVRWVSAIPLRPRSYCFIEYDNDSIDNVCVGPRFPRGTLCVPAHSYVRAQKSPTGAHARFSYILHIDIHWCGLVTQQYPMGVVEGRRMVSLRLSAPLLILLLSSGACYSCHIDCCLRLVGPTCAHARDASPNLSCAVLGDFPIRLAAGPNSSAGVLQVYHSGVWGTVCGPWSRADTLVACRQLGFLDGSVWLDAHLTLASSPILSNVNCVGNGECHAPLPPFLEFLISLL